MWGNYIGQSNGATFYQDPFCRVELGELLLSSKTLFYFENKLLKLSI